MRLVPCYLLLGLLASCTSTPTTHPYASGIQTATEQAAFSAAELGSAKTLAAPAGMVYVPGGVSQIGSADGLDQEKPVLWAKVDPFFMDETPITVAQYRAFVQATGYKTQAETFGDAGVFDEQTRDWTLVKGACWHHPQGPEAPAAPDNHPVTQVSWHDATAYATWAKKRLPSELEWEHAARNGRNDQTLYPFGNELSAQGKALANTWNGTFPDKNLNTDGFRTTSPVGYYGKTPLGLTDMTGNVWEWCSDWKTNYGDMAAGQPALTEGQEKAMRGGSFLCEPGWCHGYRVSGRSFSTPETGLMHVGFRCVRSVRDNS
jgi:formylglycine-generating enzyme